MVLRGTLRLAWIGVGLALCLGVAWGVDLVGNNSGGFVIDGVAAGAGTVVTDNRFDSITITTGQVRTDGDVTLSGGSLTIGNDVGKGSLVLWNPPAADGSPANNDARIFEIEGGTLNVGYDTNAGYMEAGRFIVSGGIVNIGDGGEFDSSGTWADKSSYITGGWLDSSASQTTANAAVSITGGTINMGSRSHIQTTAQGSTVTGALAERHSGMFHIGGNATINMAGETSDEAAVLKAHEYHGARESATDTTKAGWYTKMLIDGNATINVTDYGMILSRDTTMNGGKIDVKAGGVLQLAGGWAEGAGELTSALGLNHPAVKHWGVFKIDGGEIVVANTGLMDLATYNIDLQATGGSLTGGLTVGTTVPTVGSNYGVYARKLTVDSGKFIVDNFTLAAGGAVTVGTAGNLSIGNNITISTTTANSLVVNPGGTMTAMLTKAITNATLTNGVITAGTTAAATPGLQNALSVVGEGRVYLDAGTSLPNVQNTITDAEITKIATALGITKDQLRFLNASAQGQNIAEGVVNPGTGDANVVASITNPGAGSSVTVSTPGSSTAAQVDTVGFNNGVEAGSLNIAGGSNIIFDPNLTVAFDANAQLLGLNNNLVTVNGQAATPNIDAKQGFALGSTAVGVGNVLGGTLGNVSVGGKFDVNNGSFEVGDVTVGGDLVINNNAALGTDSITMTGGDIYVGSNTGAGKGTLETGSLSLGGGTLFLDPIWGVPGVNDPANATAAVIGSFIGDEIDGDITVGQNSHLTYGVASSTDRTWFDNILRETGAWGSGPGNISAALAVGRGLVVDSTNPASSITVDGSIQTLPPVTPAAGTARFAANSLFLIDVQALNDPASPNHVAIQGVGGTATLTVETGAILGIYNAKVGDTVQVFSGFNPITSSITGWNVGDSIFSDSVMLRGDFTNFLSGGSIGIAPLDAHVGYGAISGGTAGLLNTLYSTRSNDTNSPYADRKFFSRATSIVHNGAYLPHHIATIEGVTGISAVGGSQVQAYNITRMATDAVRERFQFATGFSSAYAAAGVASDSAFAAFKTGTIARTPARSGLAIWATPTYRHTSVDGMRAGSFDADFDSDMGGVSLGVDFTAGDNVRFGLAGNIGWGDIDSESGAYASTNNDFDYLGANAFVGFSMNNLAFVLDGGFMATDNKLTQANPLGTGTIRADADVHAWNIGVNAEYLFDVGSGFEIAPHAGVRYEALNTRGHNVHDAAGTILNVHSDTQHLLTIPVGVRAGKTFRSGKWGITPYADLGVLIAAGDRDYEAKYSLPTVGGSYRHSAEVVDAVSFDGSVGLRVTNGRFFGGAGYNLLTSADATSHALSANLGITF